MNKKPFDIHKLVDELPAGLERATLRILGFHVGRSKAISRRDLVDQLARVGFDVGDRAVRAHINQLRKDGHMICSAGGEGGGYYLAANWTELEEFAGRELHSRAMDLLEQESVLRKAGEELWGPPDPQIGLFKLS